MARLATVELQLIMHNLATSSLLALAQCSRSMLRAADAPFAWLHTRRSLSSWVQEVPSWMRHWSEREKAQYRRIEAEREQARLKSSKEEEKPPPPLSPPLLAPAAHSLRRHVPISLTWGSSMNENIHVATAADVESLLAAVPAGAAVHELEVPRCLQLQRSHWIRILAHAAIQQLRTLRRHSGHNDPTVAVEPVSDGEMLSLIAAHLPHLHTLHMDPFLCWTNANAMNLMALSPAAAAAAKQPAHADEDSGLDSRQVLIHLILNQPRLYGSLFAESFLSPHLHSLQTLKLTLLHAAGFSPYLLPISSSDYAASFSALTRLHTLTLEGVHDIDSILPHVALAPRLQWLTVQPIGEVWNGPYRGCTLPSKPILRVLLETAPKLHCTLVAFAADLRHWNELQQLFGARLELRVKEPRF